MNTFFCPYYSWHLQPLWDNLSDLVDRDMFNDLSPLSSDTSSDDSDVEVDDRLWIATSLRSQTHAVSSNPGIKEEPETPHPPRQYSTYYPLLRFGCYTLTVFGKDLNIIAIIQGPIPRSQKIKAPIHLLLDPMRDEERKGAFHPFEHEPV